MTGCILSLTLRTITDKNICIISNEKKRKYCSRYNRKMLRDPLVLFKIPSAFDIFQSNSIITQFAIMVHLERPYNNKLHSSLLDRCIMSKLTDFETKSRRTFCWDENFGQCRRKCSLSSIPV